MQPYRMLQVTLVTFQRTTKLTLTTLSGEQRKRRDNANYTILQKQQRNFDCSRHSVTYVTQLTASGVATGGPDSRAFNKVYYILSQIWHQHGVILQYRCWQRL